MMNGWVVRERVDGVGGRKKMLDGGWWMVDGMAGGPGAKQS